MDQASLTQLLEISHAIDSKSEYVQAGGGNTSEKSADGRTMAINASGTTLAQMSEIADWAELDLRKLLSIFDRAELASLPAASARFRCWNTGQPRWLGRPRAGPRSKVLRTRCWGGWSSTRTRWRSMP